MKCTLKDFYLLVLTAPTRRRRMLLKENKDESRQAKQVYVGTKMKHVDVLSLGSKTRGHVAAVAEFGRFLNVRDK